MTKALKFFEKNRKRFLDELFDCLKIPSVSANPARKDDVWRCAKWVADHLKNIRLKKIEIIETSLHPLVYAESEQAKGKPTLLIYGHYDVQPEDPVDKWTSPPFEPEIRDNKIFARGVVDDKGQLFAHIKAVEAWLAAEKFLPVNIKFILEGEEECGSDSLDKFLHENAKLLKCDAVIVSDSSQFAPKVPAVCYGLRGICYFEVLIHGPKQDLHSGVFGGAVSNPANALVKILSSLKDKANRINIPNIYDDVRPLSNSERAQFASLPFNLKKYKEEIGANDVLPEACFSALESTWARPSLDVNGLFGGYQGPGSKTIIPAFAGAKVSIRLVPNQDPDKVADLFVKTIHERAPRGVKVSVNVLGKAKPFIVDPESPLVEKAKRALEMGFGHKAVLIREGGSIPIVTSFTEVLKSPVLLLGFGLPTDGAHSPDEHYDLENFYGGIKTAICLYDELKDM